MPNQPKPGILLGDWLDFSTGLCRGEICALQWNDLNPRTGELRIERQVHRVSRSMSAYGGRYSLIWPDGKKHTRNVYDHSEAECEALLAEIILEIKAEIAAEKERIKTAPKAS